MKRRILIAEPDGFSPEAVEVASTAGEVVLKAIDRAGLEQAFDEFDVFWFRLGFRLDAALLRRPTRRVSAVVCPVTGLDHIDLATCHELGIRVISLKGEVEFLKTIRATAELTLGLTLALLRHIPQAETHVRAGGWDRDGFRGAEIFGKRVGVVGVGRLGTLVAGYFQAFGAQVTGFDVRPFSVPGVGVALSLEQLVADSDIVTLHVSYDASTHHLVDAGLLRRFRPSAVLINTSRGGVVDSAALRAALEEKRIAGAALDVVEDEHQAQQSVLVDYAGTHANLLLTPHIGGNTRESFVRTERFVAEKLVAHLREVTGS